MQKSHSDQLATNAHRRVKASTTLNRRYVRRPEKMYTEDVLLVKKSSKVKHFAVQQVSDVIPKNDSEKMAAEVSPHPLQKMTNTRLKMRQMQTTAQPANKLSAKELKDRAIKKALSEANQSQRTNEKTKHIKLHFGFPRIALALSCTVAALLAIVYFVNLNMPDISLKVAALQTGFDASYPGYVPRDYTLSGITSEEGRVTLNFKNQSNKTTFSLTEEKSAWDSDALLNNYIKVSYGENYSVIKEQGLTIYVNDNDAAWVNGGVLYTIKVASGDLTKKQIKSIASSL